MIGRQTFFICGLLAVASPASEVLQTKAPNVTVLKVRDEHADFNLQGEGTVNGQKLTSVSVQYRMVNPDGTLTPSKNVEQGSIKVSFVNFELSSGKFNATVRISDLIPGEKYFFRFLGVNKAGESSLPSKEVEVNLLPAVPNVAWTRKNSGMLTLAWNNSDKGNETAYTVSVAKNNRLECGYSVTLKSCYGNSYTLTHLDENTVYRLEIYAQNLAGRSRSAIIYYPE